MVENELLLIIIILLFISFQLYERTGIRKIPGIEIDSIKSVKKKIMKPFARPTEKAKPKINDDERAWKNENNIG